MTTETQYSQEYLFACDVFDFILFNVHIIILAVLLKMIYRNKAYVKAEYKKKVLVDKFITLNRPVLIITMLLIVYRYSGWYCKHLYLC